MFFSADDNLCLACEAYDKVLRETAFVWRLRRRASEELLLVKLDDHKLRMIASWCEDSNEELVAIL